MYVGPLANDMLEVKKRCAEGEGVQSDLVLTFKLLAARYCAGQQDFVVASNDQQKVSTIKNDV